ncbi:MAG: Hsp70 family protein [Bdellovibrionales bacterium]|nr:Hsp70 family protein [Bdellovibrionales bacterium]
MPKPKNYILGIDLGTTNSCASYVDDHGIPRIIRSSNGTTTLPSVVSIDKNGRPIVGQPALDHMITNPSDTIYGSKRLIGRKFRSLLVQEMVGIMPYNIVSGTGGEAAVLMGGQIFDLSEIASLILCEIKEYSEGALETELENVVITVPAYYTDSQRQAVKRAGEMAGFNVNRIVNEPTAAAIAYGLNKNYKQRVLVYDLGGGTFDVSVLEIRDNDFKVIATGGDTFLGGIDIDIRLTGHLIENFKDHMGKDLVKEKIAIARLRLAAEQAKCQLSIMKTTELFVPFITEINQKAADLKLMITRDTLEKLSVDLIERTLSMCDEVLETSGIKKSSIDEIVLVGGQTRMPLIYDKITKHFRKKPKKGVHPEEVVALGASILANPTIAVSPVTLKDVLSIPIGIAMNNGKFRIILRENTPLPASRTFKLTQNRAETLMVDVYQGNRERIMENEYLGTFCFPPPEEDEKGRSLDMRFELSKECILRVSMRNPHTGEQDLSEMITLQTPHSLKRSMEEALQNSKMEKSTGFRAFAQRILGMER